MRADRLADRRFACEPHPECVAWDQPSCDFTVDFDLIARDDRAPRAWGVWVPGTATAFEVYELVREDRVAFVAFESFVELDDNAVFVDVEPTVCGRQPCE